MSTVLVTGGTGVLGRQLVAHLRERGDEVRVLSRHAGAGTHVGDLSTGVGVAAAAQGAEVIVHAASGTQRFGRADREQTAHLLQAATGVHHLVYVSIVGIEEIPYRYYKRKLACERQIASSGIPYTIFRATQFHELIGWLLRASERLPLAPLPLDFRFQTIAATEVAERAAAVAASQPAGKILNIGGPEVLTLGQMAELWRTERGRPRRMVRLPLAGQLARAFREGRNTCPEQAEGTQTWTQFVAATPAIPYKVSVVP